MRLVAVLSNNDFVCYKTALGFRVIRVSVDLANNLLLFRCMLFTSVRHWAGGTRGTGG